MHIIVPKVLVLENFRLGGLFRILQLTAVAVIGWTLAANTASYTYFGTPEGRVGQLWANLNPVDADGKAGTTAAEVLANTLRWSGLCVQI